ncbi:MAG: MMPL family transporter, partial [Thermoleophilaceae bacterium]|nr:MMPL family transporter [Thermoleophilaceae bacterium]
MFDALARLASRHPRRVVAVALLAAVTAGALGAGVADRLNPYGADDPGTESIRAIDRLEAATGLDPATGLIALVKTDGGPRDRRSQALVERVARRIERDPTVGRVMTFYRSRDRGMVARDGRSQFIAVNLKAVPDSEQQDAAERLGEELNGSTVKLGGFAAASADVNEQVEKDLKRAEMFAFPILFVLSLLFFRSMVAAALPLLVGGLAILGTFAALKAADHATDISLYALNLTTGLGLGLAIDYSLFMVARYREEIMVLGPCAEALRRTMATAGRTVLFSSLTVAAALASLLVFPQNFLYSMGLGGVMVAVIAATVALVVLPAVLMLLGERVNALSPRWLRRRAERDARPAASGVWYRLSRFVMARPGRVAVVSATVLIAVGLPALGMNFTWVDATVLPESAVSRQVDTALKKDFAPGRTTRIGVVVDSPPNSAVSDFATRAGALPGAVGAAEPVAIDRETSLIEVFPRRAELSESTQQLVRDLRAERASAATLVTGQGAQFIDLKDSLVDHLPLAILIVVVATMLILFLMTGSLVLPLKALLMNVLTLSATFGLLVLIFQDGRLEGVLDYTSQGALETTQPVLLFALAFGLSTDYGVFLLSRIKEARDHGASDKEAVAIGIERTGRIVTAAALLFSIAIGAFATSEIIFVKESGVGTALAVLIDATIIRALLVPALMELLGRRNWWAPAPLRRLHARFGLDEGAAAAPEP